MHIGFNQAPGGHAMYKFNEKKNNKWDRFPGGGAKRITVDNKGRPWVTNNGNQIYRWMNNRWNRLPGAATDIGAGS